MGEERTTAASPSLRFTIIAFVFGIFGQKTSHWVPTGRLRSVRNGIKGPVRLALVSPIEETMILLVPMTVFDMKRRETAPAAPLPASTPGSLLAHCVAKAKTKNCSYCVLSPTPDGRNISSDLSRPAASCSD